MKCPFCGNADTQVKDSRPSDDGAVIKRRRQCPECNERFTTSEYIQLRELTVVKKDGQHKQFERGKLVRSMMIACRKRPVTEEQVDQAVNRIVRKLESQNKNEVLVEVIGEAVMEELAHLDKVAYIRFASVYNDFRNPRDFEKFLDKIRTSE